MNSLCHHPDTSIAIRWEGADALDTVHPHPFSGVKHRQNRSTLTDPTNWLTAAPLMAEVRMTWVVRAIADSHGPHELGVPGQERRAFTDLTRKDNGRISMDHTNGPLSGMDSTPFQADSSSIFAPASTGASLPPLPSFENPKGIESGQPGLLGRGNARQSGSNLDGFAGKQTDTHSIEFRVARADSPVRRLRLTGNRYTFGSAEGCSIRLSDPSLRPMHAVLTRDRDRVVIRAYSAPIVVNENRINETTLSVGDRLRLGEYEFELLSISTQTSTAPASSLDPPHDGDPSSDTSIHQDQTAPDDTVWRQRLRKEIDQWRSKQVECDLRESRIDEREAHLRGRESELWSRAENLYRREAKVQDQESTVFQMHDDYADRQQELLRLREDTHHKQRLFQQRESEFAQQESEYRQKLEEATAHLLQSQAQATAATEAVQEMRQQFDALNEQIEELSHQQSDLKRNEETERGENQRMRSDLETQRDAAIDAQAEGEARRREALDRVEEMTAELDLLRNQQAGDGEAESQKLLENEATIDSLRKQVEGLQETVDEASEEANQFRGDYRDALDSVRQLENLVAQSNQRGDTDRDQWATDADSLRAEIESLSGDLERTREDLEELREANQSLTTRLHDVETQRDHAVQEISDRPTREAFDHLRDELESANQVLANLRLGITKNEVTDSGETDKDANLEPEASNLSVWNQPEPESAIETPVAESSGDEVVAEAGGDHDPAAEDEPAGVSAEAESPPLDSVEEESPNEVWPTYQVSEEVVSDSNPSADLDHQDGTESSLSVWDLDSSDEQSDDDSEELIENTGVWNPDQTDESFSDIQQNSASDDFSSTENSDEEHDENTGSLANLLIADLDNGDKLPDDAQDSFQDVDQADAIEPVATDDQLNFVNEESVADDEGEEVVGLMSLLADDPSEDVMDSSPSDEAAAWDREYPEESDSQPVPETGSDSVWDINQSSDQSSNDNTDDDTNPESFSEAYNSVDADVEPIASELDQPQEHVDATAMMPSMEELEDEEQVEADSFASYQQQVDPIEAEPSASTVPQTSHDSDDDTGADKTVAASVDVKEESDDDSIEAYMNRLLGRVQGTPGTEDASPTESVSLSASSVSLESSPESTLTSESLAMGPQAEIDPDAPLIPRSHAPERNSNLSAMRELANQSARNAISRSTRIQTRNMQMAGMMNFGVAVVAILFGLGASLMLSGALLYLAWLMVVIISVISIRDGLRNLSEARTRMQAAERGELPESLAETLSSEDDNAAKAEDRLAQQSAAAQAARDQHQAE